MHGHGTVIGDRVQARCSWCEKVFLVRRSQINRGRGKFCGRACAGLGRRTSVPVKCLRCGKMFDGGAWQVAHGWDKYCGRECYDEANLAKDRFWKNVRKTETCWLWTGGTRGKYGRINVKGVGRAAHRFSWELHRGEVSEGFDLLHTCPGGDNPLCVNPDHLRVGTQADNAKDAVERGQTAAGERNAVAKLTEEIVRQIRSRRQAGESLAALGREFGVTRYAVWSAVVGRTWRHVANTPAVPPTP